MRLPLRKTWSVASYLARSEVRSRYARSVLGSFWITVQQAIFVAVAAIVFPGLFGASLRDYVPYFAVSLLMWNFFSACLLEAQDTLVANGPLVRDRGFSPDIFLFATFIRNLLMTGHAVVVPLVAIVGFRATSVTGILLALPGLALFLLITAALTYALGILAAQYRDLKRICESVLQLAFLVTPILWQPEFAKGRSEIVVHINPLAHMFDAWRVPLLQGVMDGTSLAVSAVVAVLSVALALGLSRRVGGVAVYV